MSDATRTARAAQCAIFAPADVAERCDGKMLYVMDGVSDDVQYGLSATIATLHIIVLVRSSHRVVARRNSTERVAIAMRCFHAPDGRRNRQVLGGVHLRPVPDLRLVVPMQRQCVPAEACSCRRCSSWMDLAMMLRPLKEVVTLYGRRKQRARKRAATTTMTTTMTATTLIIQSEILVRGEMESCSEASPGRGDSGDAAVAIRVGTMMALRGKLRRDLRARPGAAALAAVAKPRTCPTPRTVQVPEASCKEHAGRRRDRRARPRRCAVTTPLGPARMPKLLLQLPPSWSAPFERRCERPGPTWTRQTPRRGGHTGRRLDSPEARTASGRQRSWSSSDESVDALERAIAVLRKQAHDRRQASLVQLKTLKLTLDDAKKAIDAFLRQDPDEGLVVSAPEANAYEFQSGGVIEMLEKLLDKFNTE